jgi:NTP pyrophosphatase (non-canonical NTP hydrolase)
VVLGGETMNQLTVNIENWATFRGLDKAQPEKQMLKLIEEVGELAQGLAKDNLDQVIDSIGDVYVVLTILSLQLGLDIDRCVATAFDEIKDRKGKMVNGVFVKESDLHD